MHVICAIRIKFEFHILNMSRKMKTTGFSSSGLVECVVNEEEECFMTKKQKMG